MRFVSLSEERSSLVQDLEPSTLELDEFLTHHVEQTNLVFDKPFVTNHKFNDLKPRKAPVSQR